MSTSESEQTDRPSSLNIVYSSKTSNIMKIGIPNVRLKNWSETFECRPELYFAPKTEKEISEILELAKQENKKVRVVGSCYSPSDIACTSGILISLQYFNKVLEIDKTNQRVKVQAGIVLNELHKILYCNNMALSVLGSVSEITLGGAICVAVHGTGIEYGTISSYVTELDMILADGSMKTLSNSREGDIFQAALCSLGSLGIILNITIQCEPAFNLQMRQYGLSLKDVIENLDVHLTGSDHFRFMWFPYTDNVVVSHCTRTDLPALKISWIRRIWNLIIDYGINYHILEFCYYISSFFPHIVPYINRFFYYTTFSVYTRKIDRSYKIFNFECLFKQYVNEWAIPLEKTGVVLWELRDWMASNPDFQVHFPLEVRFCKADNIFLSPAHGRDTCYINTLMYRPYGKCIPYEKYWEAYERIMAEADGRPHWAKAHSVTADRFRLMYPYFGKWCAIRQKLDPTNMFFNPYMARIFSHSKF